MSAQALLRVLFVDRHPLTHVSMRYFLEVIPDLQLIASASSGDEALGLVARLHPDVVLMDVHMPGVNGIAATREITARFPSVRVIALTSYDDSELVQQALRAGATSYLLKSVSVRELADAIRATRAGRAVLSPEIRHLVLGSITAEPAIRNLPGRALLVLRLVVQGLNDDIARQTAIAARRRRSTRYASADGPAPGWRTTHRARGAGRPSARRCAARLPRAWPAPARG